MRPLLLLLALLPAACDVADPLLQPRLWHPNGANDANLQAMIADPQDLLNGAVSPVADGTVLAAAVARYRADKIKALPDSGLSKIGVGTGGAAAPAIVGGAD